MTKKKETNEKAGEQGQTRLPFVNNAHHQGKDILKLPRGRNNNISTTTSSILSVVVVVVVVAIVVVVVVVVVVLKFKERSHQRQS